jgi:hypothetical protein
MGDLTVNGNGKLSTPVLDQEEREEQPVRLWINRILEGENQELPLSGIIRPRVVKRFESCSRVSIGGYDIPILNSLTAAESIFGNFLRVRISNRAGEFRAALATFSKALQEAFPNDFPDRKAANESAHVILNGEGGKKYDDFLDNQSDLTSRIFELSNKAMSAQTQDLMLACFMLAHRVDPDVRVADICSLTKDELAEIGNLWRKEANNGVDPEPEPTPTPAVKTPEHPIDAAIAEAEATEIAVEKGEAPVGEQTVVVEAVAV